MADQPPPFDPHATLDPLERATLDPEPKSGDDTATDLPSAIGRFAVRGFLGAGTFGTVYCAYDPQLDREVALKVAKPGAASPRRFRAEAKASANLRHPHIVPLFEAGDINGQLFFASAFIPGTTLEDALRERGGPFPPRQAADIVRKLADALAYAHGQGVIHRDVKSANIMLDPQGEPHLLDFGLALRHEDGERRTQDGSLLGSPAYLAPEVGFGERDKWSTATDQYALGAVLYELLTEHTPFSGPIEVVLYLHQTKDPEPPCRLNNAVPRDLNSVCLKCLEKDPARRYTDCHALAADLGRWLDGQPTIARPIHGVERFWRWCRRNPAVATSLLAVAASLLAALMISTFFGIRAERARRDEADRAQSEETAKREAESARQNAQRQLVDVCSESGLTAARDGDQSLALLWFARAVALGEADSSQDESNRIRIANWRRQVCLPEGTFGVPGFQQRKDRIRNFQFSPDGQYLLTLASTGHCIVWDRSRSRPITIANSAAQVSAAVWDPVTGLLAVGDVEGRIRFLAAPEFKATQEIVESDSAITVLSFSPNGRCLAMGDVQGVRVWDRDKAAYVTPRFPHDKPVITLSFSSGGNLLATSARDFRARVFRVPSDTSEPLFPPVKHEWDTEVEWIHDGPGRVAPRFVMGDQILFTVDRTANRDARLVWRSATTGNVLSSSHTPGSRDRALFTILAVGPRTDLVAGLWGNDGWLFRPTSQSAEATLSDPSVDAGYQDALFSADGKTLVTCGVDTMVRFWSTELRSNLTLAASTSPITHPMQCVRVDLSSDGRHVATALWDGTICLWHMPEGPPIRYRLPAGFGNWPALSADGRLVLPRGISHRANCLAETRVYDAESGAPQGPILNPGGIVIDAAFSPDGTRVATANSTGATPDERNARKFYPEGKGGNVQFWNWKSGERIGEPVPMPSEPRGLAFHPNGRTLAVVCAGYYVLLLDAEGGRIVNTLEPAVHTPVQSANQWWSNGEARFSPDGQRLVTWEMSPQVHIWDADGAQLLHMLPHTERVSQVAFHPAESTLATGSWDATARVWDMATGKLLAALQHPGWVVRLQFSPDGKDLITNCVDGRLRVWDWRAGKVQDSFSSSPRPLIDFGFIGDRRWMVAMGHDELTIADRETKKPLAPQLNLKPAFNLAMGISSGKPRAIVGGFSDSLVGYDLNGMVAPSNGSVDDIVRFAELVAGRRIVEGGNVVPLTTAEWTERWERLQKDGSSLLKRAASDADSH